MPFPIVAIVGAPNVGKSTLFNRLVGHRQAIVTDESGMTRDRMYGVVTNATTPFRIVDTGGITLRSDAPFAREIEKQAETALAEAALVLFVIDIRAGLTTFDRDLADMLRRRDRPLILVANKADSESLEEQVHEHHGLGLGPPRPLSAEHGRGVEELVDAICARLRDSSTETVDRPAEERRLDVTIVGRPNVGKSSIFNRLAGEERALVSDVPGTTRDAVDTLLDLDDRRYRLIDTAGLRRPGKIRRGPERFSVSRARDNLKRANAAILVLDADAGFAAQDAHVAGHVISSYKPMVVAVNKWDLVDEREEAARRWEEEVRRRLRFAKQLPMVLVSAKSGQRVLKILDLIDDAHAAAGIRVPTAGLNRWLEEHGAGEPTARSKGGFRLRYGTQTGIHPPTFVLFCNDPARLHFSGRRQLENSLRDRFGFGAAPIRLRFRGREGGRARRVQRGTRAEDEGETRNDP